MRFWQTIQSYIQAAWQELQVNKLRTGLSLTGITIGIFCIIAVFTVIDSMKDNISNRVNALGSDVVYVNRWPWMDEGGEYKWWEFFQRPSMTLTELRAVERDIPDVKLASLCLPVTQTVKIESNEASTTVYGVTENFDLLQNIDIDKGRYLSSKEIEAGAPVAILGKSLVEELIEGRADPMLKKLQIGGHTFNIIGTVTEQGQNSAGFDFDKSIIVPYYSLHNMVDYKSLNNDPILLVQAKKGVPLDELKTELDGTLRRVRKVRPGAPSNYALNELSAINERLDEMFAVINSVGALIGGFSLIVGGFGIANIMFVSVRERTKYIGLKKALGAKRGRILWEFLIEAVMLCVAGGIIGVMAVFLLGLGLEYFADFPVTLSMTNVLIGIGISAAIGLLAGFIPAYSASNLDPVVAIRSN